MKRAFACIICFVLLLSVLPVVGAEEVTESNRYGFTTLTKREQYIYDCLLDRIDDFEDVVMLDESMALKPEEVNRANQMLCSDWPELFYYLGTYQYNLVDGKAVTKVYPQYTLNGQKVNGQKDLVDAAKVQLQEKAQAVMQTVTGQTDTDKALQLHDTLLTQVEYVEGSNDQSAYGALVQGSAVCAGYTRAYQLLLRMADIPAFKVDGSAVNQRGEQEQHSWLMMWLDEKCVYTDITWDDGANTIFHAYFALSLDQIATNHRAGDPFYSFLPSCDHEGMDYFTVYQGPGVAILTDATDVAVLATQFVAATGQRDVLQCAVRYEGADFVAWLQNNQVKLAQALNLVGQYQCSVQTVGKEYQIEFTGTIQEPTQPTEPGPSVALPQIDGDFTMILVAIAAGLVLVIVIVALAARKKK